MKQEAAAMKTKYWSLNTRFLHLGMVATVTAQLFISLIMSEPDKKGSFIGDIAYNAHEIVGLTALGIVTLHWIWSAISQTDGSLKHLFPWRGAARKQVTNDITSLLTGKLPKADTHGGLSSFIHGLGFLAVTGVAISGAIIFLTFPESGHPGFLGEMAEELHEAMASLVWAYWIAHGSIAIIHHLSGNDTLKRMFSFNMNNTTTNNQRNDDKSSRYTENLFK